MKIQQVSLFLENKPGQILEPCRLLAGGNVNIRTLSVADTQQFGILRMIVSDWKKAIGLLEGAGYVASATEVVAVEVPDRPGGLVKVMEVFENADVNIEYMYAFPSAAGGTAVLIFRFDQPDAALELLRAAGISVVDDVNVYGPGEP